MLDGWIALLLSFLLSKRFWRYENVLVECEVYATMLCRHAVLKKLEDALDALRADENN